MPRMMSLKLSQPNASGKIISLFKKLYFVKMRCGIKFYFIEYNTVVFDIV